MDKQKKSELAHWGFEISLLLKGLHGLGEVLGGLCFLFLNPARMNRLIQLLFADELSENPQDLIVQLVLRLNGHFSTGTQHFAVWYLLSHGLIKCVLILLLWRKKTWAYPLMILMLVAFCGYQMYRFTQTYSIFMILLTIFDGIMMVLTWIEYRRIHPKSV